MMATQRSLTNRLRQHSRRSGFAVGVSMAAAIAICIAGFIAIYVQLQPFISDFVSQEPPGEEARVIARPDPTEAPADEEEVAPADEPAATEAPEEDVAVEENEPEPTDEPSGFDPDFQLIADGDSVNLRSAPSVESGVVVVITPAQALQFLDETVVSDNPGRDQLTEGQEWWRFRTEVGEEGFIREIDVEPFQE